MLLLLLLLSLGEEESGTAARVGTVEVEVSSLPREVESESEATARLSCVDDVAAVTNAAAIVPVGRADKRTLDCCCRIVVKGRLMGTWERSIRLLLCLS
jgi:hypothetical protein